MPLDTPPAELPLRAAGPPRGSPTTRQLFASGLTYRADWRSASERSRPRLPLARSLSSPSPSPAFSARIPGASGRAGRSPRPAARGAALWRGRQLGAAAAPVTKALSGAHTQTHAQREAEQTRGRLCSSFPPAPCCAPGSACTPLPEGTQPAAAWQPAARPRSPSSLRPGHFGLLPPHRNAVPRSRCGSP